MTHEHAHHDEAGLADMLDLDAELLAAYLDELTEWVRQRSPNPARTVVDVGAGTGTGSLALARRFDTADIVAIDRSPLMLDRLRAAAARSGVLDRLRIVRADLDAAWPEIGTFDVAWAASSLHHVDDPDRLLREIRARLSPGGLLAVIEMDTLPRFLPDDLGLGRPGLEARCHELAAQAGGNAHPDWRPHLERAGFEVTAQRGFSVEVSHGPRAADYALAYLSRFRTACEGRLARDDLGVLEDLLADDGALLRRRALTIRAARTAWAARRP